MAKLFLFPLFIFLLLQAGCSSESLGSSSDSDDGSGPCPSVGDLDVEFQSAFIGGGRFCRIGGELTQSARMAVPSDGVDWFLDGDITVSSGTLTISPGVEIFAEGDTEFIYIQNGASLTAVGTEDQPIMMSSNDDEESGGGEWGGLIIESLLSGGDAQRLQYLVVAEAGSPVTLGGETYSANITLVGEHNDTLIQFLQSHASGDDGITLISDNDSNASFLESILVTAPSGDGVFFDNFSGLLKNLLVIQSDLNDSGAGIRGSGSLSEPLIINITLFGGDTNAGLTDAKVGIFFEQEFERPVIANVLIANYQGGCYDIASPTDLGSIIVGDPMVSEGVAPDPSVDGVHCVNEFLDSTAAPVDGNFFSSVNIGANVNLAGFSYYDNTNIDFESDVTSAVNTAGYYLNSIGGLENVIDLRQYNDGDGDLENGTDADDDIVSSLFGVGGVYSGVNSTVLSCNGDIGDQAECELTQFSSLFNLRVIGAVESSSDTRFDDWTVEGSLE